MLRDLSKNAFVTSYPFSKVIPFYQFMRNAILGKVSLNQGKIIFRLKDI